MVFSKNASTTIKRFNPHLLMFIVQTCYAVLYFIAEASFNKGLNPYVYITYRHFVGSFVMIPFAYFLESKLRPKMTLKIFLEIFLLSLVGIGLALNLYFASLTFTSSTFITSMTNTIPSLTFLIAIVLRLEIVDIRNPRGIAKIIGTVVSLAGVITMTLYKGPAIKAMKSAPIHIGKSAVHEDWIKGPILTVFSCILFAVFFIMQAYTLKRYPAQLSLTAWMNFLGAAQSAVFTVVIQHKSTTWLITSAVELWSIVYAGVVICGFATFIQLWCTEQKGPVFVTLFNPLTSVLAVFLAFFVVGEKLRLGSLFGGVIVIIGLYILLWGKDKDQVCITTQGQSCPANNEQADPKKKMLASAESKPHGDAVV